MEAWTPLSSSKINGANRRQQSPNPNSPSPSPLRQWRPAAQKNIRNKWSKLVASKDRWFSAASEGRFHATSLVNAHLTLRYLPRRDLGALKDMPGIRQKASEKTAREQEGCRVKLLSSYKDMVASAVDMVQLSNLMRCFLKVSSVSSLLQFSDQSEDENDPGDGGGAPVFSFLSISNFENLAKELVEMFLLELSIKRFIVVELLNLIGKEGVGEACQLGWLSELYPGEYNGLRLANMLSSENDQPIPPRIQDWQSGEPSMDRARHDPSREVLEVYLTTWLCAVNINTNRMREIISIVEEEIQVKLS